VRGHLRLLLGRGTALSADRLTHPVLQPEASGASGASILLESCSSKRVYAPYEVLPSTGG